MTNETEHGDALAFLSWSRWMDGLIGPSIESGRPLLAKWWATRIAESSRWPVVLMVSPDVTPRDLAAALRGAAEQLDAGYFGDALDREHVWRWQATHQRRDSSDGRLGALPAPMEPWVGAGVQEGGRP